MSNSVESERIFKYALDMICIVGFDGYFKVLNPSWEKTLGWSIEELKSKSWLDFIHPEERDFCIFRRKRIIEDGDMLQFENRYVCKDGSYKWLSWSCHPYPEEKVIYGIARDVTEKKMYQEEASKHEKLESLGVLAGGIAHDFNNLLASLYGNIEMALANIEIPENSEKYLLKAISTYNNAKNLADQLLTFSKGGDPVKKTGNIAKSVVEHSTFALSGSNVGCEYDIDPELKPVDYDNNQMAQVIQNIVLNSKQAMPNGGIIGISVHNVQLDKGDFVRISIADSGVGIPENHLKNIFDPFFTTKEGGSGLGLPTSYSIIQKHIGFIEVESETGVGTVFHIYLPVSEKELENTEDIKTSKSDEKTNGSGRILIMDDQGSVREIMKDMLESLGYSVVEANDGEQAVEMIAEIKEKGEQLDCAVLDLTVPGGVGGKDAVSEIHELMPELPVFATSGYSNDPVMAVPGKFGFAASLKKPSLPSHKSLISSFSA
jgi:two-component system, cell cycle sensor histidine kinase and response regulator CckA